MSGLELLAVGFAHPDVTLLVAEVQAEYTVRYGGPDETPLDPAAFDPPRGAFFVGYLDGVATGMGGWRFRDDIVAFDLSPVTEIKRMYVVPAARRHGLARRVLAHLEDTARGAGSRAMVLETGIEQPEAIGLYTSSGYTPVEGFGHYRWSPKVRYFGKPL